MVVRGAERERKWVYVVREGDVCLKEKKNGTTASAG